MKKSTKSLLFYVSLFLSSLSFCLSQIEHMSWASNIIFPTYSQGIQGIKQLEANKALAAQDTGFSAISDVIRSSPPKSIPSELLNQDKIIVMKPVAPSWQKQASPTISRNMEVRIIFPDGNAWSSSTEDLRKKLAEEHTQPFVYACIIFGSISFLSFIGFGLQMKE